MDRKRFNDILSEVLAWLMIIGIAGFLILFCSSCASRYITVPEYHYEAHNTTDTLIMTNDVVRENNTVIREADSTLLADLGIRLQNGERAILVLRSQLERALSQQKQVKTDTVVKVDSVCVPYPVEKQLTRWESLKLEAGGYLFAVLSVLVVWFVVRKRSTLFRRPRDAL